MKAQLRKSSVLAAFLAVAVLTTWSPTRAGELTLGWQAPTDALTAGLEVEVATEEGQVIEILDVGAATRAVVTGLEDGRRYRFRLRPYDRYGNPAEAPTKEIITFPEPRIDSVEGVVEPGQISRVSLYGANFDDGAWVVSRLAGVRIEQTVVVRQDLIVVSLVAGETVELGPASLLVVNPVRKTGAYVAAHPETLDLDASGTVDGEDLRLLEEYFGVERTDPRYRPSLDPTGDGVIDGEDAALIRQFLSRRARARRAS